MKIRDLTENEINKITEQCRHPREKAFFTVMRQSGLPPHTIKELKIENLEKILEPDTPIPCRIKQSKSQNRPNFIGAEAVKYLKQYLKKRSRKENLTSKSFLFTAYNNQNKRISTKDVIRAFRSAVIKLNTTPKTAKGKPSELRLYKLIRFYKKNAKDYLTSLKNINTGKDNEFYRKLYEEEALPHLEIEPKTEIDQLKLNHQKQIEEQNKQIKELNQRLANLEQKIPNVEKIEQALKIAVAKATGKQPEEYKIEWTDGKPTKKG